MQKIVEEWGPQTQQWVQIAGPMSAAEAEEMLLRLRTEYPDRRFRTRTVH